MLQIGQRTDYKSTLVVQIASGLGHKVKCLDGETEIVPLSYHLGHDIQIQFGREEFCLVTGLRFGVDYSDVYEEGLIPFRRCTFDSAKDGKPITGEMLEA
ncbi:hypothetical protein Tco_0687818 [Tanacetum coccineum]